MVEEKEEKSTDVYLLWIALVFMILLFIFMVIMRITGE